MPAGVEVNLHWYDFMLSAFAGFIRIFRVLEGQLKDPSGRGDNGTRAWRDMFGATCEFAVAKHFNWFWSVGEIGSVDFPPNYQVKSSDKPGAHLLIRKDYRDEDIFILVVGCGPTAPFKRRIVGWLRGGEAKVLGLWHNETNPQQSCYWIEQRDLKSIETMPIAEKARGG